MQDSVGGDIKKISPVIKWTGGKYREFNQFSPYLPPFQKYFEPFFGGGGVFFALQPPGEALLNDKSEDLIRFYSLLGSSGFKKELEGYADAWHEAGLISREVKPALLVAFKAYLAKNISPASLCDSIGKCLNTCFEKSNYLLFSESFIIYPSKFFNEISRSIFDKCKRLQQIFLKEGRSFNDYELGDHIETGIKSGLYMFLRMLTNLHFSGAIQLRKEKAAANWYFVREFCYASMFRYNSKGEFNIPYGGIAYNKKNFRQKVDNIFSKPVKTMFKKATFYNLDFEAFLEKTQPGKNDFVFLDPPYDSDFSEYDQNRFDKEDQLRLRNVLFNTKAKWMMVIKETAFIRSLYTSGNCRFIEFDKTYTYNVRGRNNREAKHLIIINYEAGGQKLNRQLSLFPS
jgi:DNA adenine methylase